MEKFKKIETTSVVNENMEIETKTRITLHKIRTWSELTREEQEEEIKRRQESIYMLYQEDLYDIYKMNLEDLQERFKNITFEDIYLDSNSQGWWVDRIKDFRYHTEGIEIYGEYLDIEDIDFHIRKYIEDFTINVNDYYVDGDKLNKIVKTKKYQNWLDTIHNEIQEWVDLVNEYCKELGDGEYYCPYDLDNEEDKEWLDNYFAEEQFETIEDITDKDTEE